MRHEHGGFTQGTAGSARNRSKVESVIVSKPSTLVRPARKNVAAIPHPATSSTWLTAAGGPRTASHGGKIRLAPRAASGCADGRWSADTSPSAWASHYPWVSWS